MIFTRKLSHDEGFQVFKDELSHTHFQFIWGKISYKGNKAMITHTLWSDLDKDFGKREN